MPNLALTPNRPEYYVQTGSMFENPHGVPHDEIVQYILENPAEVVAQVVFGKYVESSGLVFSGELIQEMIDRKLERVVGDRWYDKAAYQEAKEFAALAREFPMRDNRRRQYATGVDFARQTDYTVLSVLDIRFRPARLVYWRRLNRVPWESIYREVGRVVAVFGDNVLCDKTGMGGDVVMDALESRLFCAVHDRTFLMNGSSCPVGVASGGCGPSTWIPLSGCEGYEFSGNRKKELIEHLRNVLSIGYVSGVEKAFGWLRTPPLVQLEEEMAFYVWDDKGMETDCLMSLALAAMAGLDDVPGAVDSGSPWG